MSRNVYFIIFGIIGLLWIGYLYDSFGERIVPSPDESPSDKENRKDGVVKKYDDIGNLRTAVSYKDGKKDGISYMYYQDGETVQLEMPYAAGKRQGTSKKYFESGKIYAETSYNNDKIHGIRKVFYRSGKVKSEMPYGFGYPGIGLREYLRDGSEKELGQMTFRQERNLIYLDITKPCKQTRFYIGSLIEDQFFNELDEKIRLLPERNNQFVIDLNTFAPSFLELQDIVCACKTSQGNMSISKQRIDISSLKKVN